MRCLLWQAEKGALEEYSVLPARILSALDRRQQVLSGAANADDVDDDVDAVSKGSG